MKRAVVAISLILCIFLFACGGQTTPVGASPSPSPSEEGALLPGNQGGAAQSSGASPTPAPTQSQSSLYDPSIFVIEASGSWREELAPEYYADYECEIYLDKIDANDNRATVGSYQGVFWMKTTLDTSGYISEMLKDVPVDASFDAGGEAVCDNLAVSLNTEDDKAWVNYSIAGEDGKPLPLTQDTPVAKGSFVAVARSVYLEAHASGAQGEKADYSAQNEGDLFDVNYVIHVEPDSMESGGQRKVIINLSGEGFNITLTGVMKRLPGYTEDVADYTNSSEYKDSAWRHLQE